MSVVRLDEFASHLGVSTPPTRAKSSLDIAEVLVGSYLSLEHNRSGGALQERQVIENITPVRNKTILEVCRGPITGLDSITYDVVGYKNSLDESTDPMGTDVPTWEYVWNPDFTTWSVSGKNKDGSQFIFVRGATYHVCYRTGWCAGNSAYEWQWYRNDASDTWDESADRLGWGFVDGTATATNGSGGYLLGPQPSTYLEGIHYETGGSPTDDDLLSPAVSFSGADYPFVVARVKLLRASSTGYPTYTVNYLDSDDNRTYMSGKKDSGELGYLDRMRAVAITDDHQGYCTLVADMGYQGTGDSANETQNQDLVRGWVNKTITQIGLRLWQVGASDPNGSLFLLDYVRVCDGLAAMPTSLKIAVMETARAVKDGAGTGVVSEQIGDYQVAVDMGEASKIIPPIARQLLDPYRRPSW